MHVNYARRVVQSRDFYFVSERSELFSSPRDAKLASFFLEHLLCVDGRWRMAERHWSTRRRTIEILSRTNRKFKREGEKKSLTILSFGLHTSQKKKYRVVVAYYFEEIQIQRNNNHQSWNETRFFIVNQRHVQRESATWNIFTHQNKAKSKKNNDKVDFYYLIEWGEEMFNDFWWLLIHSKIWN